MENVMRNIIPNDNFLSNVTNCIVKASTNFQPSGLAIALLFFISRLALGEAVLVASR
jgi:hypothetical protein